MRHFVILFFLFTAISSWSQVTEKYHSPLSGFYRAEDLFQKEQFSAARKEFRLFADLYTGSKNDPFYIKALYYEAVSALELFNNDAILLLENFNKEYPESIFKYTVFWKTGRYFYQKKDYPKAIEWFNKLNKSTVEVADLDEYFFKLGYANFYEKNLPAAKSAFFEVKETTGQYGPPALYYYSHICYSDKSYQSALEGFERLLVDDRFKAVVPYYITQIYYLQGKYTDVVAFGPNSLDSLKPAEKVEMNHIIGDSYYRLGKYDEAISYLEYYNEKSNTTRDDDYALATAYSKSSNCVKAVKYYDKVARIKDTLGQIALYHAGECYMNLNQPAYARTAFEAAAQLDMDVMIQEDALYNYAILSYKLDLNVYDEAVESFELYLRKYPNSPRKTVVYQYLVNVYSSTKNYSKALESLDKVANKDIKLKSAYQLIAFNRGVELYQRSDYQQAIDAFKLVEKYPIDQDISAKAIFWIGDAEYQLKHFDAAVTKYRAFLAMPTSRLSALRNDAYYNIGYAYLANKNYVQTQEAFRVYLTQPGLTDKKKLADAHMRLADEYYRTRQNNQDAVNQYIAALELKSGFEDQALYYMARTYGFLGKRDDKIQRLLDIINNYPNSKYVQSSVYEVALTYFNAGNDDKAKRYFEQVIRDYPKSTSVIDAFHNLGNIAFKKGNYDEAELNYKKVLSDYVVNDTICKREVYALADIYVKQGRLNKKEELSQLYACADSISTQVEDDYYRKAFDLYADSLYAKSIVEWDDYLMKYSKGKYLKEALNYKADALYILKREEEAVNIYKITLLEPNNDFTEVATQRTSKFLFNKGDREGALPYYTRLEQVTSNPELLNNARIGQMRCHFVLQNFENAVQYAARVLSANQTPAIRLESEYIHGISLAKINRFTEGLSSLEYVVKNTTTVIASEAKYTIAVGYFDKADMTKSENEVRALLKMKPGYDYWIAKALILQTRILMAKKDLFQAENTIQSVISNYPIKDDGVLAEAGELYDEIMRLKSQPKTIQTPDPGTVIELEDKTGNK